MRFIVFLLLCAGCGAEISVSGSDEAGLAPEPPPNAIGNGGFEHPGGWAWQGWGYASIFDTNAAHAGTHAVLFQTGYGNGYPNPKGGQVVSDPFVVPAAMSSTLTWYCRAVAKDDRYSAALNTSLVRVYDASANNALVAEGSKLCPPSTWAFGALTLPSTVNGHSLVVYAGGPALILDDVALDQSSVQVTEPADGATVSGTIAIRAAASEILRKAPVTLLVDDDIPVGSGTGTLTAQLDTRELLNGAHTITAQTTDVGGAVARAVVHIVIHNAPPDTGLIVDGSFETGGFGSWSHTGNARVAEGGPSGHYAAWFDQPRSDYQYDRLWQTIKLPASGSPTLAFTYLPHCGWSSYEDARVEIVTTGGTVLKSQSICSYTNSWQSAQLDLSPWRGKTVAVRFSTRFLYAQSALVLDDVNVR